MLKLLFNLLWAKLEPTKEEKINLAEKLLESTGYHVHGNPIKVKPEPTLFEKPKVLPAGRFAS